MKQNQGFINICLFLNNWLYDVLFKSKKYFNWYIGIYVSKTKEHLPRKVLLLDRRLRLSIMKSWIISSSYEDNQITKSWSEWQRILFFNQIYKPQYFTLNQITKSWLEWHRIPFSYPYTKTAILHLTEPTVQTDCSSLNGHRYFLPQYRKTTLS